MSIKVTPVSRMGSDLTVVDAARVSFGKKATHFKDADKKLIEYLGEHEHTSPFGHCFASFHVKAPIFVARQLVKHKFLRWNEISRRYVDNEPELYTPEAWRKRAKNVKQGSSEETVDLNKEFVWCEDNEPKYGWDDYTLEELYQEHLERECLLYEKLLERGVCPEQARMVLSQSLMTEWYWSGSLDAFADMCNLRLDSHTQYETRLVAEQVDQYMQEWFPVSWRTLVTLKE